ncbi:hypothetical protein AGOR_G00223860 [Albula goreensis]|uniref:EF-hand domain-containing protein n=1 Tax=Albula goreensis TaxID=1534307 RepID=A0A8T3CNT2_9TELE|nr:hypothetical protein AGOR_G00223860 [Albula goreensis]
MRVYAVVLVILLLIDAFCAQTDDTTKKKKPSKKGKESSRKGKENVERPLLGLGFHSSKTEAEARKAFQHYDKGKKGYITPEELQQDDLFQDADTNKDNKLSYEEFRRVMPKLKPKYA